MPNSCHYFKHLKDRVDELEKKFVADQVAAELANPLTFQPDLDRLAAFRLLVHAEIEDFLESKAKANIVSIDAESKKQNWIKRYPELLCLAMALKKPFVVPESLDLNNFSVYISQVTSAARTAISENNGVKAGSFLLLSVCAGKTLDEIDPILSASLNSYGKNRGDVAHKSVIHSTSLQAPTAELATAQSLVTQIGLYFDVC
jgi:hypothetical protein